MYRNVIFDFLSSLRQELSLHEVDSITICLTHPHYKAGLAKLISNHDEVLCYQVKEPRVYFKHYEKTKCENTMVEYLESTQKEEVFHYRDFTFDLQDPFYLRKYQDLSFQTLFAYPILDHDIFLGVVLFYFKDDNPLFSLQNKSLIKLANDLIQDQENDLLQKVYQDYFSSCEIYLLGIHQSTKIAYVNSLFRDDFHLPSQEFQIEADLSVQKKINSIIHSPLAIHLTYSELQIEIFLLSKQLLKQNQAEQEEVVRPFIEDHFDFRDAPYFVFFWSDTKTSKELYQEWKKQFENISLMGVFDYHQFGLLLVLNQKMNKKQKIDCCSMEKNNYFVFLDQKVDVFSTMNFSSLFDYLILNRPNPYSYLEYSLYVQNQNKEQCDFQTNFVHAKQNPYEIISLGTNQKIAEIDYVIPKRNQYPSEENLWYLISYEVSHPHSFSFVLPISIFFFQKRKNKEWLKKVMEVSPEVIFLLYDENNLSKQMVETSVLWIRSYSKKIIFDSTLFTRLSLVDDLWMVDYLFVTKEETQSIKKDSKLTSLLLCYFIEKEQSIIFESVDDTLQSITNHYLFYLNKKGS